MKAQAKDAKSQDKAPSNANMDLRPAFSCTLLIVLFVLLPALPAHASSKLYVVYMGEKQHDDPSVVTSSHHDVLTSVLGSKDKALESIVYSYKHGFSGFAAMLTESQAEEIAEFPGVLSVKLNNYHQVHTTRSWDFLGLNYQQPSSSSGLLEKAKYGEDVIVGVIDTGIWPESPSFDDSGYGSVPARWNGTCQTGAEFNTTSCNRKIIGARWYSDGIPADKLKVDYLSPRDGPSGHGTHTASTIAGSPVYNVSFEGLAAGVVRGGAPRARLAIYKVCWDAVGCPDFAILAAIDDAIHDGVDVLSLSLGGPGFNSIGTLHAVQRGISVVFTAGNNGPVPQSLGNTVPWVMTVAASTIDRSFPTAITLGNKETLMGQSHYRDVGLNTSGFHDIVLYSQSLGSANYTGKTVLVYPPAVKGLISSPPRPLLAQLINLTIEAGATGLIFAQYTINNLDDLHSCDGFMPCVLVDYEIARRIISYTGSSGRSTPMVKVSPAMTVVGNGVISPRVAAFSSRGPGSFPGILKPDVAAPGVSILAAKGNSYEFMSGTSMACPHVSAVVALLKVVHPSWSPAMIKSAIVTTASVSDRFGMPIEAEGVSRKVADPFDFGGGHMDPNKAVDPGLVYDMDAREFTMLFNCTLGSFFGCESHMDKLYQLNLPSIALPRLKDTITVQRTVTNVGPMEANYRAVVEAPPGVAVSVEPPIIRFTQHGSRTATFTVTFTAKQRVQGGYTFGSLTWVSGNTHSVRIPVAVRIAIQDFAADIA